MRCAKERYDSKPKADRALRGIVRSRNKREAKPCRSYRCPFCKGWHLTSNKSMKEQPR